MVKIDSDLALKLAGYLKDELQFADCKYEICKEKDCDECRSEGQYVIYKKFISAVKRNQNDKDI